MIIETLQKAIIEEIPDEESTKTPEIPMFRIQVEENDIFAETLREGETLLANYPGQPIIRVSKTETSPSEWDYPQGNIWIRAKVSMSQQLAHKEQEGQRKGKKSLDDIIPEHYRQYKMVFEKSASERFPSS